MSRLGALVSTGTATFDPSYTPQFIQIGDPDNADTIDALGVVIGGMNAIKLNNAAQIRALMQIDNEILAAGGSTELASRLMIANGKLRADSNISITNGGATTTDVYANSTGFGDAARSVTVQPIQANGSRIFSGFDVLFALPTNMSRATVTFANGFTDDYSPAELQALYAANRSSEASGLVNGFVVVEGYRSKYNPVQSIEIFAGSGGNCDVVLCGWNPMK